MFISIGHLEIFTLSVLASSIVPLPSEFLLLSLGMLKVNIIEASVIGGIGLTLGSILTYWLGAKLGGKFVEKVGKYIFLTEKRMKNLRKIFNEHGTTSILLGRIFPIVPHKIHSIISGILGVEQKKFLLLTFLGSIPRCFILIYFGNFLIRFNNIPLVAVCTLFTFLLPIFFEKLAKPFRTGV